MRIFGIIGVLIIGVWYLPTMLWGVQATKAMQKLEDGDASALASVMEGPAPLAWWRNRTELRETFSPDELNARRYISLEVQVPPEAILADGEEAPDETFRKLYAAARAPAFLHDMCAEFMGTLALRCDVANTSGSWEQPRRENEEELVALSGWLMYAPAYDMGDPSSVSNGDLFSTRAQLLGREELENTPEARSVAVERALAVCEGLRAIYGNCVASTLAFNIDRWNGKLNFSGMFDVYADKGTQNRETVQAALDRVVAERFPELQ